jgi:hypothetical protein
VGSVQKGDLTPGEYRVFAQVGKQLSRVHRVQVNANEEATVTIDADFDVVVHSSPKWSGFLFPEAGTREKQESLYAAAFANALDARGVVVVGIDQVRGRPVIVGALVNLMTGREIRRASINLDPDPPVERLRSLAKFIAGDNAAPGIDIQLAGDVGAAPVGNGEGVQIGSLGKPQHGGMWGGWKYITGAAAVGALGVGAYLLSVDGDCSDDACAYYRDTTVSGWATVGGGAVLAGVTVYLFIRGSGETQTKSAFIVPAHGGAYAGYSMRF